MSRLLAAHLPPVLLLLAACLGFAAPAARADVLELHDGRLVEGLVLVDGDAYVVRSRFGVVSIPAADVKTRTACRPLDEQLRDRLALLASDDTENRTVLARWLFDLGREEEGRAMAEAVLDQDPENAPAHEVLGHIRHQGVWRTPDEAKRAEGLEKHGDGWFTPKEWQNLADAERRVAEEAEARAAASAFQAEVNRAVRLMTSPDPNVRARGRSRLEALAAEFDAPRLLELAKAVDVYVKKAEELAAALAAAPSGADSGMVLGEIRATMSRLKRPIQNFETSLSSSLGGGTVKIQLPELEVVRVRTTVGIPAIVR